MASLSLAIMAHPRRGPLVSELVEQLGVGLDAVVWDRESSRWDTGRRAMSAYDPGCEYHVVVQDDAVVCRDFIAGMRAALDEVPDHAIMSTFMGTRRPMAMRMKEIARQAEREAASWVVLETLNWGLVICVPTPTIPDMIKWADREEYPNYDKRVGRYYWRILRWPTWYTWPQLSDHREVPSLSGHGDGRVAYKFLGTEASALDVRWDRGYVRMDQPRKHSNR